MKKGFTLIEVIIGVAIFLLIAISVWEGFGKLIEGVGVLRTKNTATALANELFEIVRNMPYEDVGVVDSLPPGKIPKNQIIEKNGRKFSVDTSVLWVDESFDGKIGQYPNDLSPIDNKLVEFNIKCIGCKEMKEFIINTKVAPKNLESAGNTGALFVEVVDADGDPVDLANVRIENNQLVNKILVQEKTNNVGMFQLIGAPPGTEAYELLISKAGYSSEKTYKTGEIANPVPNKAHANVVSGLVTLITFIIDKLSTVEINTLSSTCSPISSVGFNFFGTKTIGQGVLKNSYTLISNSSGKSNLNNVEWDSYDIDVTDSEYFIAGTNPNLPFVVNPDSNQKLNIILEPRRLNALLVNVIDRNNLPIADAKVVIEKSSFNKTKYTGKGAISQSDWTGGAGQENVGDYDKYYFQDGNIDTSSEEIKLNNVFGNYPTEGYLISSTFDVGTTTNFHVLNWEPQGQPMETGEKPIKIQVATNETLTATSTWDFVGPDGTSASYFEVSGESFSTLSNNTRYLRYKVFLSTDNNLHTPNISNISFSFSSNCAPTGQTYFDSLSSGLHRITISKDGFQNYILDNLNISSTWQKLDVIMDNT